MKMIRLIIGIFFSLLLFAGCKKSASPVDTLPASALNKLSYGDSVFYLRNGSSDYNVSPVNGPTGTFTAFPEGLVIDKNTGTINVSKSETGMRYKVSFRSSTGDSASTFVVISGINFPDKYYHLSNADSIAAPVYNADPRKSMPQGSFDEDKVATNSGCAIKTDNGKINLVESIRNGLFGKTPQNNTKRNFDIKYRLNDQSGNALNSINVLIYYYDSMNDVPQDLLQTVQDHLAMTIQPNNTTMSTSFSAAITKPRPPCIVIIAH